MHLVISDFSLSELKKEDIVQVQTKEKQNKNHRKRNTTEIYTQLSCVIKN